MFKDLELIENPRVEDKSIKLSIKKLKYLKNPNSPIFISKLMERSSFLFFIDLLLLRPKPIV